MKKFSKVISVVLALATLVSMLTCTLSASAANPAVKKLTGTTQKSTKALANGVTYTSYQGKAYGASSNLQFDVVEVDMSTKNLYIDSAYGADNCTHAWKGGQYILDRFQKANTNLTPVVAINADLWWLSLGSFTEPDVGGTKLFSSSPDYTMSLGYTVTNGEIYTSDRLPGENFHQNGNPRPYEDYVSFGITSDNVPVISNPDVEVSIKNVTQNKMVPADGINRVPINNTIIMYTDKGPSQTFCNNDAVEIKIKCDPYTVKHGTKIKGTVESVSLKNTARPKMGTDYIILTARGTRYNDLAGYKKNDKVEIDVSVYDREGKYTKEWQKVTDAVSGHMRFAIDGEYTQANVAISSYPATVIGITKSGNVVMMAYGQDTAGTSREGIAPGGILQLAKDLDLKDGFFLDGGGSSQMYLKDGNSYTFANNPTEPGRSVLNLLVLSTGPNRAAQGTIPQLPSRDENMATLDFSKEGNSVYLSDKTVEVPPRQRKGNDVKFRYDSTQKALKITTLSGKDPYIEIDYSKSAPKISATKNKYLLIEYMLPVTNSTAAKKGQIYLGTKMISATPNMTRDGKFHTMVVDMSSKSTWKGTVSSIRYDIFASASPGDVMYIKSIKLSATAPSASTTPTTTAPATTAPVTTAPVTTAPVTTAPVTTAPVTTAPVTTAPVTTAPVTTAPVTDDSNTDVMVSGATIANPGNNTLTENAVVEINEVADKEKIIASLQEAVKYDGYALADLSIVDNGEAVTLTDKIELSLDLPSGYDSEKTALYFADADGNLTQIEATFADGKIKFTTDKLGVFAIVNGAEANEEDTSSNEEEKDEKSGNLWLIIAIVAGGVVLAGVVVLVIVLVTKKKKNSVKE